MFQHAECWGDVAMAALAMISFCFKCQNLFPHNILHFIGILHV